MPEGVVQEEDKGEDGAQIQPKPSKEKIKKTQVEQENEQKADRVSKRKSNEDQESTSVGLKKSKPGELKKVRSIELVKAILVGLDGAKSVQLRNSKSVKREKAKLIGLEKAKSTETLTGDENFTSDWQEDEKTDNSYTSKENSDISDNAVVELVGSDTTNLKSDASNTISERPGGSETASVKADGSHMANVAARESGIENVKEVGSETANVETGGSATANVTMGDSHTANVKTDGSNIANVSAGGSETANVKTGGSGITNVPVGGSFTANVKAGGSDTANVPLGNSQTVPVEADGSGSARMRADGSDSANVKAYASGTAYVRESEADGPDTAYVRETDTSTTAVREGDPDTVEENLDTSENANVEQEGSEATNLKSDGSDTITAKAGNSDSTNVTAADGMDTANVNMGGSDTENVGVKASGPGVNDVPMNNDFDVDLDAKKSKQISISDVPLTPKTSRISYDGKKHEQHVEADDNAVKTALKNIAEDKPMQVNAKDSKEGEGATQQAQGKAGCSTNTTKQTFRTRPYDEKKTIAAMRQGAPRHEFVGYIYSSQTPRPHGIANFFLPIVPQPPSRMHMSIHGANVLKEVLHKTMKSAPRGLLPLSSIRVTWASNPRRTVYTLQSLYAYLIRFGPIEGIYQRGPNAALVIFCDLPSAAACVKCSSLGMPWDHLVASWWEPRLHNVGYLSRQIEEEKHANSEAEKTVALEAAKKGGKSADKDKPEAKAVPAVS